jgi:hypothetical protein
MTGLAFSHVSEPYIRTNICTPSSFVLIPDCLTLFPDLFQYAPELPGPSQLSLVLGIGTQLSLF